MASQTIEISSTKTKVRLIVVGRLLSFT